MNGFEDFVPMIAKLKHPGARQFAQKLCEASTEEERGIIRAYHQPTITARQAAEKLGVSLRTLARWRRRGVGPEYRRQSERTVVYLADSVEEHLNRRSDDDEEGGTDY